jgi:Rrf2 family protein
VLKVNRKVEYGLIALKHMQGKPKPHLSTVREICERYGAPFDPLAHVLRILNTKGVLQSEQGAHGGYRIAANLEALSFADLIEMIEGQLAFTDCIKLGECGCTMVERCNILSPMHIVHQRLLKFLRTISVAELVQPEANWAKQLEALGRMPEGHQPAASV